MSNLHLITAVNATSHITPKMDAAWHRGFCGSDGVFAEGNQFEAERVDDNNITVSDGAGTLQGRFFTVPVGTQDTITFDSGVSGKNRKDLLCFKITDADGVQTGSWHIVKGTEVSSSDTPVAPECPSGNLDAGSSVAYLGMWVVSFAGTVMSSEFEQQFTVLKKLSQINESNETLLWTNPSPSSDFGAQTISLSETSANFDHLKCVYKGNKNNEDGLYEAIGNSSTGFSIHRAWASVTSSGHGAGIHYRKGTISGSSIAWEQCQQSYMQVSGGLTRSYNNADLIPWKIYGVKE